MRSVWIASTAGALAVVAGRWAYRRVVAGDLFLDLSIGRTVRPLGPIDQRIEASRELVFDVIAAPYLASPPSSLADKIQVLERSEEMVLAAHRTPIRNGLAATTVEPSDSNIPVSSLSGSCAVQSHTSSNVSS